MNQPPTNFTFNYDTMTLVEAWPWFKGALMILTGCIIAGILDPFGALFSPIKPPVDYEI